MDIPLAMSLAALFAAIGFVIWDLIIYPFFILGDNDES